MIQRNLLVWNVHIFWKLFLLNNAGNIYKYAALLHQSLHFKAVVFVSLIYCFLSLKSNITVSDRVLANEGAFCLKVQQKFKTETQMSSDSTARVLVSCTVM